MALQVDLHKTGSADFIKAVAEGIDQVSAWLARNRGLNLGVVDVVPRPGRAPPVPRAQLDPDLPFGWADLVAARRNGMIHCLCLKKRRCRHACI
jgi:hypothetical protein